MVHLCCATYPIVQLYAINLASLCPEHMLEAKRSMKPVRPPFLAWLTNAGTHLYRRALLAVWLLLAGTSCGLDIHEIRMQKLEELRQNAHYVAVTIIAARAWNSQLDGVYAVRSRHLTPNPYLKHPQRDLPEHGNVPALTMINPAYMTRMVGDILGQSTGIRIGLRSTQPLNPGNMADGWESQALNALGQGAKEVFGTEVDTAGRSEFRYMLPVTTDSSCLGCHEAQGSWIGEMRGGLSVTQPYPAQAISDAILRTLMFHLALFGGLGGLAYGLLRQLEARLRQETDASGDSAGQE